MPFLEWRTLVDVRTTTTAVEQQETITKDNVPVKINAVDLAARRGAEDAR